MLRWIVHQQMNVVVFAIHLDQLRLEIVADVELVGQVVGFSTFFNGSGAYCAEVRTERPYLSRRAL